MDKATPQQSYLQNKQQQQQRLQEEEESHYQLPTVNQNNNNQNKYSNFNMKPRGWGAGKYL